MAARRRVSVRVVEDAVEARSAWLMTLKSANAELVILWFWRSRSVMSVCNCVIAFCVEASTLMLERYEA